MPQGGKKGIGVRLRGYACYGTSNIRRILNFRMGLFLDGVTDDSHIASNVFNISMIAFNQDWGVLILSGPTYQIEGHRFNIDYMVNNETGGTIYLCAHYGGLVVTNTFRIQVLECPFSAAKNEIILNGEHTFGNQFYVDTAFIASPKGTMIISHLSPDNYFRLNNFDPALSIITTRGIVDNRFSKGLTK
jgi:hypothetical protein